ncbi:hypothetical protein AB0K92_22290 [Streptomyces sp. NPDC052687]|uniref:hypothetical protein n=1 Tax=Streptomyces sp. NPDC052687 TaxID=3154759 RepID=UPI0034288C14
MSQPGSEAQIDYGFLGPWIDPRTGKPVPDNLKTGDDKPAWGRPATAWTDRHGRTSPLTATAGRHRRTSPPTATAGRRYRTAR